MQWRIHRFDLLPSTMDQCRAYAEAGAAEGTVVLADVQTHGRGRAGRAWYSPPGQSLYLSVLLRPSLAPHQASWLTLIGAVAVAEGVERSAGSELHAAIKWPNDVLICQRKVAGVLLETTWLGERLDYAILGVGLNVNTTFDDAPEDVRARAISLREALGKPLDRERVLEQVLQALDDTLSRLPNPPITAYAARLTGIGQAVRLFIGEEIVEGVATALRDDGALVVRTANGLRAVTFGEVQA